jgi:hypothetical protein
MKRVELGIPDTRLHGRVIVKDPLGFFGRIRPEEEDADRSVCCGAAQDDLSLIEEMADIGRILSHHRFFSRRHGLKEIRMFWSYQGEVLQRWAHDPGLPLGVFITAGLS